MREKFIKAIFLIEVFSFNWTFHVLVFSRRSIFFSIISARSVLTEINFKNSCEASSNFSSTDSIIDLFPSRYSIKSPRLPY